MDDPKPNTLWDKVFDIDSQSGTGRFVALILVFVGLGGSLSWLLS